MNPADLLAAMKRTVEQLAAYNDIAKALTSTLELGEVLELVMHKVRELLRPRNWSLLLLDERTGRLAFEIAVGEGSEALKGLQVSVGEGIAGQVFREGKARRVDDVASDPAFSPRFDRASAFRTRSVVAAPLRSRGRVLGVIELVNGEGDPRFSDEDVVALSAIADFAAIAIENARNFQRVQDLTLTDEHTGVFNARHLRAVIEQEVLRSRRFHHPLSLIFLDLDHFKRVNDTHGHLAGSACLREVGELLVATSRQVDVVCRYGGDEFAVLLVETGADGALAIAERVREVLADHVFLQREGVNARLSASLGVATFPDHVRDAEGLLHAADFAMYAAKAEGRNKVCPAPPYEAVPPGGAAPKVPGAR